MAASGEYRTEQGPLEQRKPERANTENNVSNICASLTATHVVADNEGTMYVGEAKKGKHHY